MATIRQTARKTQNEVRSGGTFWFVFRRKEGKIAVYSRMPGAIARAILMALLILTPSAILPWSPEDAALVVMLVALSSGLFVMAEYGSSSPSLVEFRDAEPFNRVRFLSLFFCVFSLSVIFGGGASQSGFVALFDSLGRSIGTAMDFPFSPVRLMLLMMPEATSPEMVDRMRIAASMCYLVSLSSLAFFIILIRTRVWPRHTKTFNFWVNLPTFDPTAGGDVVDRLNRDSTVNIVLGFLLPFIIPAVIKATSNFVGPLGLDDPQTLIWTVAIWAFLPSSLLMRGVALSRVAGMIHVQRKKAYAAAAAEGMLPV